jgi:hypothetical protein
MQFWEAATPRAVESFHIRNTVTIRTTYISN